MPKNSFTAPELIAIAAVLGKEKLYGLPDILAGLSQGEQQVILQNATDALLEDQVLKMNFDGVSELSAEYSQIAETIFSCQKCLTVNLQQGAEEAKAFIFWRGEGNSLMMAEAIRNRYVLSYTDRSFLKSLVTTFDFRPSESTGSNVVIPGISLIKAKRACDEGNVDDAIRLVRQAGANEKIAAILVEGLCCRADVFSIALIEPQEETAVAEHTYLQSNHTLLHIGEKVVNLRSCAEIAEVSANSAKENVGRLVEAFLA